MTPVWRNPVTVQRKQICREKSKIWLEGECDQSQSYVRVRQATNWRGENDWMRYDMHLTLCPIITSNNQTEKTESPSG